MRFRDQSQIEQFIEDIPPVRPRVTRRNLAERQLRPAVIARKISCGNKTLKGARTALNSWTAPVCRTLTDPDGDHPQQALLCAVADLYTSWLSHASYREQAKSLWQR